MKRVQHPACSTGIGFPDSISIRDREVRGDVAFIQEGVHEIECHGRIIEIDRQIFTGNRSSKTYQSMFRGEPYQLSSETIEYSIRVENISSGLSTRVMDFSLLGNYLGRIQVGDEVFIRAKKKAGRRMVTYIYNATTDTVLRPGSQLSAGFIRWWYLFLILCFFAILYGLVRFLESGAISGMITGLIALFLPIFMPIILVWFVIRMIFRGKRR